MGIHLHDSDARAVLAGNLRTVFDKRKLSGRSVAKAIHVSNKTVSNMLKGVGHPQLDKLQAVAGYLRIPLWQLLCPALNSAAIGDADLHELIESFLRLSDTGQAQVRRTIRAEDALAHRNDERPALT